VIERSILATALLAVALSGVAGCDEKKSVLDEGVCIGAPQPCRSIGAEEARTVAPRASATWERELHARAIADPRTRFPNLPAAELRRRLDQAAEDLDFEVVSFRLLEPKQLAPRIVVRTKHYVRLAEAAGRGGLLRRLDPRRNTGDDRTGWRYEGFYFEAQDEHGTPFFIVYNFWRGPGPGGGQWARSERLFPFPHL
jgi:hypothetical protein